jgi:CheY-like chemotaxis protein
VDFAEAVPLKRYIWSGPMRALIVDDSLEIREVIAAYLTAAGYPDPAKAADAETALALLGVERAGIAGDGGEPAADGIDVILMDIMMPGMDGIEACARIKRNGRTAEIPVLMAPQPGRQHGPCSRPSWPARPTMSASPSSGSNSWPASARAAAEGGVDRRRVQEQARNELARLAASHSAAAVDADLSLPSSLVAAAVVRRRRPAAGGSACWRSRSTVSGRGRVGRYPLRRVAGQPERASGGLDECWRRRLFLALLAVAIDARRPSARRWASACDWRWSGRAFRSARTGRRTRRSASASRIRTGSRGRRPACWSGPAGP